MLSQPGSRRATLSTKRGKIYKFTSQKNLRHTCATGSFKYIQCKDPSGTTETQWLSLKRLSDLSLM